MKTIEELRNELLKIGEKLGRGTRPNHYFFIPDQPDGVATPYLEIHGKEYHFIVGERGLEIQRKVTLSDDEILYWFVDRPVAGFMRQTIHLNENLERFILEGNIV